MRFSKFSNFPEKRYGRKTDFHKSVLVGRACQDGDAGFSPKFRGFFSASVDTKNVAMTPLDFPWEFFQEKSNFFPGICKAIIFGKKTKIRFLKKKLHGRFGIVVLNERGCTVDFSDFPRKNFFSQLFQKFEFRNRNDAKMRPHFFDEFTCHFRNFDANGFPTKREFPESKKSRLFFFFFRVSLFGSDRSGKTFPTKQKKFPTFRRKTFPHSFLKNTNFETGTAPKVAPHVLKKLPVTFRKIAPAVFPQ